MPYSTQATFAGLYVVDAVKAGNEDVLDLENPPPSQGAELPCPAALEFMADVHEAKGKEGVAEAVKVGHFLTCRLTLSPYSPMLTFDSCGVCLPTHTIPFGKGTSS